MIPALRAASIPRKLGLANPVALVTLALTEQNVSATPREHVEASASLCRDPSSNCLAFLPVALGVALNDGVELHWRGSRMAFRPAPSASPLGRSRRPPPETGKGFDLHDDRLKIAFAKSTGGKIQPILQESLARRLGLPALDA